MIHAAAVSVFVHPDHQVAGIFFHIKYAAVIPRHVTIYTRVSKRRTMVMPNGVIEISIYLIRIIRVINNLHGVFGWRIMVTDLDIVMPVKTS